MVLTLLIIEMSMFAFYIQPIKAGQPIYIKSDGSISPSGVPISSVDNVTYVFTGNINDPIVVERSNIIIDGNRYILHGSGSEKGFDLSGMSNVTIKNATIENFLFGIYLFKSSMSVISENNVTNNEYGIWLTESSLSNVSTNVITSNGYYGINLLSSPYIIVSENNVTNNKYGIKLYSSSNTRLSGNNISNNCNGIFMETCLNNTFSGNVLNGNTYNVNIWGYNLLECTHSIDTSNLVDGKPIYYIVNQTDLVINLATHPQVGYLALVHCSNVTVEGLILTNNGQGVLFAFTTNSKIAENNLVNNYYGILLLWSSYNNIVGNSVTNNDCGIYLDTSSFCNVSRNSVINNYLGIDLHWSSFGLVSENYVRENHFGILLYSCSGRGSFSNRIYHNDFLNNLIQVRNSYCEETPRYTNLWDDGFEGNYWSNYTGVDLDHDGIGNFEHVIDENNQDNHPLMGMFSDFKATSEHHVQTICNSSISDFQFSGTAICFNVTGENGTSGFCRICIPTALINEIYKVFVNGTEVSYNLLSCSNSTHSYLYFNYTHSTQEVIIIPEFPSFRILLLFMITTLLAVTVYRRKHSM